MILINRTFDETTPESVEVGDYSDSGMLAENEPCTFRELVALLRWGEPSCWPARGDTHEWVTHSCGETRDFFEHGIERRESVHYSSANHPHAARYWRLAMVAAGLVKN